jgi:predicted transcriptional regulator
MKSYTHASDSDLESLEEMSLAMAQAEMQISMDESGLKRSQLAEKLGRPKSFISRILSGNHNLTIRTMARVFGACGFEIRFNRVPIEAVWTMGEPITATEIPARAGVSPMRVTSVTLVGKTLGPLCAAIG